MIGNVAAPLFIIMNRFESVALSVVHINET